MPRVKDREPIGVLVCEGCGADVGLKVSITDYCYYTCDGRMDTRQCGHKSQFGFANSRKIMEQIKNEKAKQQFTTDTPQRTVEPAAPSGTAAATEQRGAGLLDAIRGYVKS